MSSEVNTSTFPYREIWEDFSTERVTIEQLSLKLMIFRVRFRLLSGSGSTTPMIETDDIVELMDELKLGPVQKQDLAEQLYLVAGYYLGPEHLKQWQTDVQSSARTLKRIRQSAEELSTSLELISAGVSRALRTLHEVDPIALEPNTHLETPALSRLLTDLARVAGRVTDDISNRKRGRTTNTVRLNALQLVLEITEAVGVGKVTISPGNMQNHEPQFTGTPM